MENKTVLQTFFVLSLVALVAIISSSGITGGAVVNRLSYKNWDASKIIDEEIQNVKGICNDYWRQCELPLTNQKQCEVCCNLKYSCIIEQKCNKIWGDNLELSCIEKAKKDLIFCLNIC